MHFLKTSQRLDYLETLGKIDTWLFISIHDSMYVCNNTPCNSHLTPEIQTLKMEFLDLIKEVQSRGGRSTSSWKHSLFICETFAMLKTVFIRHYTYSNTRIPYFILKRIFLGHELAVDNTTGKVFRYNNIVSLLSVQ